MKTILYACPAMFLSCSLLVSAEGTVPRLQASSYPSHTEISGVGVGAVLLRESEVKQRFSAKISDKYLVVEVAFYPRKGESIDVIPDNVILRLSGTESGLRPENPGAVAAALQTGRSPNRDIRIIPRAEVGIQTGTRYPDPRYDPNYPGYDPTYDPRYDRRYPQRGGVYTSTGVGVVLGDPRPGSTSRNGNATETELLEKSLPSGSASKPVAGHLYFRVDKKTRQDRNARFSLDVEIAGKSGRISI